MPTRIISVQVCALHRAHAPALEWQPRLRVGGFEIRSLQETLASRPSSGLLSLPHLAAPQERMSAKGSHSRAASAVPLIRGHMADMRQHATVSEQLREVRAHAFSGGRSWVRVRVSGNLSEIGTFTSPHAQPWEVVHTLYKEAKSSQGTATHDTERAN